MDISGRADYDCTTRVHSWKRKLIIFSTEAYIALSSIMKTIQKGGNFPVGPNLSPTYYFTNLHVVFSKITLPSGPRAFAKEI